jgi:hypothetical protein
VGERPFWCVGTHRNLVAVGQCEHGQISFTTLVVRDVRFLPVLRAVCVLCRKNLVQRCTTSMKTLPSVSLLALSLLAACSDSVNGTPPRPDASADVASDSAPDVASDVSPDAPLDYCLVVNGGRWMRGMSCPAGDGRNTFSCYGPGPYATCTTIGCVPPGQCRSNSDCTGGSRCNFNSAGCGVRFGTCGPVRDCAEITEYCGCDGTTFRDCPGGITSQQYTSTGPCAPSTDGGTSPDAGSSMLCAGAHTSRDGGACLGPADNPLPLECCSWNCNLNNATCDSLLPLCEAGLVPSVVNSCWGPCVPARACSPIPCESTMACPPSWVCNAKTRTCAYRL